MKEWFNHSISDFTYISRRTSLLFLTQNWFPSRLIEICLIRSVALLFSPIYICMIEMSKCCYFFLQCVSCTLHTYCIQGKFRTNLNTINFAWNGKNSNARFGFGATLNSHYFNWKRRSKKQQKQTRRCVGECSWNHRSSYNGISWNMN